MTVRVLIITDHLDEDPTLLEALQARADQGPCTFRLLVTNPAKAEFHLVHPERHVAVERLQPVLQRVLDRLSVQVGVPMTGAVSIRHDPFEAVEEDLFAEPADEVVVAVHERALARRLHLDLPHRLQRRHLPVTVVHERQPAI